MDFLSHAIEWFSKYGSYVLVPFISALAGLGTNWLAIKMTFYPLKYVGKFPFGWQGVVPANTRKFAAGMVDTTIGRMGGLPALKSAVDMEQIKKHLIQVAKPMVPEAVHGLMREQNRILWENLPAPSKKLVYQIVENEVVSGIDVLTDDVSGQLERLLDLRELVVTKCEEHPDLLNRMVFACSQKEIDFLTFSGLLFGFVFGLVQTLCWYLLPLWWVLPFFGVLVGTLTNWIAIQLIFSPLQPIKIGPIVLQGLFLRRQKEIADEYSKVLTEKIITATDVVHMLFHGSRRERTLSLLRAHISSVMESQFIVQLVTQATMGPQGYADFKDAALATAIQYTEELSEDRIFNKMQAEAVQAMLTEKIVEQSPEEFQNLVRPIFHEDEWILVAIGGLLGGIVGWLQLIWLFGDVLLKNIVT